MDYKITRSQRQCASCSKNFIEREDYHVAIIEGKEEFTRREYCTACWEAEAGKGVRAECFSFWKTRVPEKSGDEKRKLDVDAASVFFRKLAGSDEPNKRDFAYLLALLLMRKKVIILQGTQMRDGREFMVLRFRGEEEDYLCEDPRLGAEELQKVKDDLGTLLNMDTEA
jgi:hypothetical protein